MSRPNDFDKKCDPDQTASEYLSFFTILTKKLEKIRSYDLVFNILVEKLDC